MLSLSRCLTGPQHLQITGWHDVMRVSAVKTRVEKGNLRPTRSDGGADVCVCVCVCVWKQSSLTSNIQFYSLFFSKFPGHKLLFPGLSNVSSRCQDNGKDTL